jgi:imidazolonepropionase
MKRVSNIGYLARCPANGAQEDIAPVLDAELVFDEREIHFAGSRGEVPTAFRGLESIDAGGKMVIPGLVDCHTHLAFAGWRADEFKLKILGRSYLEIAKAGGGIASTLKKTREATFEELLARSEGFLAEMIKLGVTTVECKSGYGLNLEDELKTLRVYAELKKRQPLTIVSTVLGAHIVPPEYKERRAEYIKLLVDDLLPQVAKERLADFCDVFVEESAFSVEEARQIFKRGTELGLRPKLHADQLSNGGGAALAAEVGAISADHLEFIDDAGIEAMKAAGVIAVTLPLASLFTWQKPLNARRLIESGLPVALATDFNPGSSPSFHYPLSMMLACTLNRMTPAEVLKASTIISARAIGLDSKLGSLEKGKAADFCIIDAKDPDTWMYNFRGNACERTFKNGVLIYEA